MNTSESNHAPAPRSEILFKDFRLTNVYGRLDPATAQATIGMWLAQGVLTPSEAQRRVTEVVWVVRNAKDEIIGVNTVYTAVRPDDGRTYYFYRTYIRPDSRGVFGLPRTMLRLAIDHLRGQATPQGPAGLIIVAENTKLMRRSVAAIAGRMGLHPLGKDARGHEVWGLNFDGSLPRPIAARTTH